MESGRSPDQSIRYAGPTYTERMIYYDKDKPLVPQVMGQSDGEAS